MIYYNITNVNLPVLDLISCEFDILCFFHQFGDQCIYDHFLILKSFFYKLISEEISK